MSNALAIAATVRVIAAMIDRAVTDANPTNLLGNEQTSVHAPDRVAIGDALEKDHLNLFLYTVSMNAGWRNVAASRNPAGERIGRPPLAVDLHFLLTAYGAKQYHPELLLGIGMEALHEQPFLDRAAIRSLFAGAGSDEDKAMATAALDSQIEQIKISPHDLSADELYKLWSAFGSKCRPSAAYVATVVLIESRAPLKSAKPVMTRNLAVIPFERPVILDVKPAVFDLSAPVKLTLTGTGFQAPGSIVEFGAVRAPFDSTAPDSATVTVPANVRPGLTLLKVSRTYAIGAPPDKLIADSNPVGVIVQPSGLGLTTPVVGGVKRVVVTFTPAASPDQTASLLLDQLGVAPAVARHYQLDATPADIGPVSISFNPQGVAAGQYLARLKIDGVESVPAFDPALGFTGPTVTL
jgi:hypothetical protein